MNLNEPIEWQVKFSIFEELFFEIWRTLLFGQHLLILLGKMNWRVLKASFWRFQCWAETSLEWVPLERVLLETLQCKAPTTQSDGLEMWFDLDEYPANCIGIFAMNLASKFPNREHLSNGEHLHKDADPRRLVAVLRSVPMYHMACEHLTSAYQITMWSSHAFCTNKLSKM